MVGTEVVGVQRCRLAPRRAWAFVGLASSHTDVGLTERHEECLEVHRRNLDAALARLPAHPEFRWTAECGLQLISRSEEHTSELQSRLHLVCRLLLEKKKIARSSV